MQAPNTNREKSTALNLRHPVAEVPLALYAANKEARAPTLAIVQGEALGLVTKVVAPDKLASESEALTQSLLSRAAASLQGIKEYLKFASRMDPASAFSSILNAGISSSQRRDPPQNKLSRRAQGA